jgi:hypothetical protein
MSSDAAHSASSACDTQSARQLVEASCCALTHDMLHPFHCLQGGAAPAAGSAPGSHFIISDAALQGATSGLFELRQLSAPYATSGWLLHILCNKNIKESYDAAHNSVVDALKVGRTGAWWTVTDVQQVSCSGCVLEACKAYL